jgi:hypothetical protein
LRFHLLIGMTALEAGYSAATANVRHFGMIPGLGVVRREARGAGGFHPTHRREAAMDGAPMSLPVRIFVYSSMANWEGA